MRVCGKCETLNKDDAEYCGACGGRLDTPESRDAALPYAAEREEDQAVAYIMRELDKDTSMSNTGGVLIIISGIIICLLGLATTAAGAVIEGILGFELDSGYLAVGIGIVILGVLVSLVGRETTHKRRWKWALASCIITMLFGGILLALGTAALVLIAVARQEFID